MPLRSMTGFAQVKGRAHEQLGFLLSLKSVNHRFLDLHFRLPSGSDSLEMKLRRLLKEKMSRGHVEVGLNVERGGSEQIGFNRELVGGYVKAFRLASIELGIMGDPDLNVAMRLPGALDAGVEVSGEALEDAVMEVADEAITQLNAMREQEGAAIERELRERMERLRAAAHAVEQFRAPVLKAYVEKLQARIQEMIGSQVDRERILQEAALLVDRSDIQEEVVRLQTHVQHFLGLMDAGGETGKKLDFLLQEMNREANTLLSKTSGLASDAIQITELGLEMKSEIEKSREQVQNLE